MKNLLELYQHILTNGHESSDRTGVGTIKIIAPQLRFDLSEGFPAVTTKRLAWKSVVSELLWFIEGSISERRLCEILHGTTDSSKSTIWTANCRDRSEACPERFNGSNVGNMYGLNWRMQPCEPHGLVTVQRRFYDNSWKETATNKTHKITKFKHGGYVVGDMNWNNRTSYKLFDLWRELLKKGTLCEKWKNYTNFYSDVFSLWGFQEYVDSDYKFVLDKNYFGADVHSPETSIFVSKKVSKKIKSEMVNDEEFNLSRPKIMVDQLSNTIDLIQTSPDSRRMVMTAWNSRDIDNAALGMCHPLVQFFVIDGKLSCHFYMRSSDAFLGLPFNIASYALLTHMIAYVSGLGVGELVYTGGDCHLYKNHVDQVKEQLSRIPYPAPKLLIDSRTYNSVFDFDMNSFKLDNYCPHDAIKAPMAV